jgi:CDP-ribitol ribitolphosphotransferase / teichoic acid ribitol-phosphate polymerase
MKIVLFCENKYAIDILYPLQVEADKDVENSVLWYVHEPKIPDFSLDGKVKWTHSMQEIFDFSPEAIFVPGNIVPYYLPGVKIQIFHGYAAEKKDHWIIRRYFDTYFTQGPYFTEHFNVSAKKYGDFEVVETGWTKQDWIKEHLHDYDEERKELLSKYGKSKIILYAPTFSPKLTSLPLIKSDLEKLINERDVLLILKFHPLTKQMWIDEYKEWAEHNDSVIFVEKGENVTHYLLMSDVMISDTSSTVYEFLLLGKPVITLGTIANDIYWENIHNPSELVNVYDRIYGDPECQAKMQWVQNNYDPYLDGKCCERMLDAAKDYISRHGVPEKRKVNFWRKYTSIKTFGRVKCK